MSATTPMLLLLGLLTRVVPLMGVTMALTPYLMPKRECFAVTVPDDAATDPYLRRLKRTYLAIMLALTAAATVACAAALALDPEILFFDEPTSALDPELTAEVLRVIKDLAAQNMTMVIVTHAMQFARDVADRVVFMDGGRIVEEGPAEQVIDHPREQRTREFLSRIEG